MYDGEFGQPYISDSIFDEALTPTRTRTGSHSAAVQLSNRVRGHESYPNAYDHLRVPAAVFTDTIDIFERYSDQSLSLTDAASVALLNRHDLDGILSFDDDFDGLIQRFDPEDVRDPRRSRVHSPDLLQAGV